MGLDVADDGGVGFGAGEGNIPAVAGGNPLGEGGDVVGAGGGEAVEQNGSALSLHFIHRADEFDVLEVGVGVEGVADGLCLLAEGAEDGDVGRGERAGCGGAETDLTLQELAEVGEQGIDLLGGVGEAGTGGADLDLPQGGQC